MFLNRFRSYRRWRGGKWARVTGMLWGWKWWRLPDGDLSRADEQWFPHEQMRQGILVAMAELGQGRTGLTIHQRLEAQGRVDREDFYVALGELVDEGLVISEKQRGGPERQYDHQEWWAYSLTDRGADLVDHIFTQKHYANDASNQSRQSCLVCAGCLPPGEQCRACGRINNEE